ncbi:MAG: cation transporter [Kiritimatiellae bacterium]|nr:cation transporter [Kiritimatiellia bacterium]MBQ6330819.1 cation transporter [Kiritimatiellia bacterium]
MQAERQVQVVRRVTFAGILVNVAIAAAKAVVGVMSSSQALVADAVHSASDLVTDLVVVFSVRYWVAPADDDHPYGHGKIEALVTLVISAALVFAAWELARNAVMSLVRGKSDATPGAMALAVALGSIVLKEIVFIVTRAMARRVRSTALEANAWHHRSDALSSIPVAVAVAVVWVCPSLWWVDAAGALIVSAFVLHVAWKLASPALQELTDAQIGSKADAVAAVALGVVGVKGVHKPRARRYGSSFQADIHIQVDGSLSVAEGHAIGHAVKEAVVNAGLDVDDVVVHVEPWDSASSGCTSR